MGGLVTACNAQDLPEGASPRCWDVDFIIGSVFTRAGLQSVYVFTNTLEITEVVIGSVNIATFTYVGKAPGVNEQFVLSDFTGPTFLNGTTVTVISVNELNTTFTAEVVDSTAAVYTGQQGIAASTTGEFVGPNVPTVATTSGTGNVWQNPTNVLGNIAFASVLSGTTDTSTQVPTNVGNVPDGGAAEWSNVANLTATGASVASLTLAAGQSQNPAAASHGTLNIPSDATVTGIQLSINAASSVFGVSSLNVQLINGNTLVPYGTAVKIPIGTTTNTYKAGSSAYQWGTTLTPSDVNGTALGVEVSATVTSGTATITANTLILTIYYQLAGGTEALETTVYTFAIPSTAGITGFASSFQAYTSGSSSIILQLLKNGVAVGDPKTQVLTTTPTVYTLGSAGDLWDSTWLFSDVNNTNFGVQITATGAGTTFVNDLDVLTYITPALVNFNYIKSYVQNTGQTYTLALSADGILWREDVTNFPGTLAVALTGILPGSFAQSATMDNREHIMFSDLSVGTDRPRVYNGTDFAPLSQVGPGAPPSFASSTGSTAVPLQVTAYAISGDVVTFTFVAQGGFVPVVGSLYTVAGTGNPELDGFTFSVLGTPPPSTTQFSAATTTATGSGTGLDATATLTNNYPIVSITQDSTTSPPSDTSQPFNGQILLWSAGPSTTTPGFTLTFFYGGVNAPENPWFLNATAKGYAIYVYIQGSPLGNGTQFVTGHGIGIPPSETGSVPFFTVTTTTSAYERYGGSGGTGPNGPGNDGNFQVTMATMVTGTPITNLTSGSQVQITGAVPTAWNNTWTIIDTPNSGSYNITSSQMLAGGIAQFQYNNASATGQAAVTDGQIIELTGLTNNVLFNTTGVVSAATGSTFQISGFPGNIPAQGTPTPESGQGVTFGTSFLFDPGVTLVGLVTPSSIFGDTTVPGTISVIGGSIIPIGPGVRQGVVYFITENEYETQPSAPFTFTTTEDTQQVIISQIPIGPPNVIARAIAITEAGQNGVPGANFYVIENPVSITVNGVTTTVPSTIINDNTTTQISIAFTDAVLLNSREIDLPGDDLFNLIELGSSGWAVPYTQRMFYGLQLNKVTNFNNLTFDGGYNPNPTGNIQPLGWTIVNPADQTLVLSTVTGQALYIKNTHGVTTVQVGMIYESAFQDAYLVPIIQTNTTYSVRVAASAPSGLTTGTLVIDLTDYSAGTGFGKTYGSFSVPLSSMTTLDQVFTGTLLTNVFAEVSTDLQLRVYVQNMGENADVQIDRIEVFPTQTPYLKAQVYGSYPGQPEAIDASSTGGIIDTTSENAQPCPGAFVMRDLLFLMKTNSMYSTQADPNSEPGGWGLHEVSNKVGTIGINSYDVGEEWMVTACRAGIFGFNGGQPTKILQELWNLWEQIYWLAGNTIVLRNDIVNKRMYIAIPLPTGVNPATGIAANKQTLLWLPNAPYNPAPTSPNVILMLNYQGMATFEEMINSPEVHTTISYIVLSIAQA